MAETTPLRNTLSRRYSTTRPLGFRGGGISPGGNLQPPTAGQVSGVNPPAAPKKVEEPPPIAQFTAAAPKAASPAATLAGGAVSAAGGELAKAGVRSGVQAISNLLNPVATGFSAPAADGSQFYSSDTLKQSFPLGEQNMSRVPGSFDLGLEYGSTPGPVPEWVGVGTGFTGANEADLAMDLGGDFGAATDFGGEAVDAAFGDFGGEAVDATTGGIPFVGPAIRLAQGDAKGAAGSLIGGAIGGPIGAVAGGFLGNACFITEAVMAAGGQGDAAPELEVLRQFRDTVLAATPQGQALIQEYEGVAPMVVEAIVQRPDALKIFQSIDAQFINPAVEAIQQGDFQKAVQIYAQMISFVTPYAAEVGEDGIGGMPAPGQGGNTQAMQQMGEHAAMVGHSPEMAGMATGDMGMAGADEDPTGYDGGPQGMQGQAPMQNPTNPMMQQFAKPRY